MIDGQVAVSIISSRVLVSSVWGAEYRDDNEVVMTMYNAPDVFASKWTYTSCAIDCITDSNRVVGAVSTKPLWRCITPPSRFPRSFSKWISTPCALDSVREQQSRGSIYICNKPEKDDLQNAISVLACPRPRQYPPPAESTDFRLSVHEDTPLHTQLQRHPCTNYHSPINAEILERQKARRVITASSYLQFQGAMFSSYRYNCMSVPQEVTPTPPFYREQNLLLLVTLKKRLFDHRT